MSADNADMIIERRIYRDNLDYPESELTEMLIGLAFQMYNRLGYGYQEKYYHRAYSELLNGAGLSYRREQMAIIQFGQKKIGRYFIDFLVKNSVVVEFKVANDFYLQHAKQVLGYLKAIGCKVGLLVLITKSGIKVKRIVNTKSAQSAK